MNHSINTYHQFQQQQQQQQPGTARNTATSQAVAIMMPVGLGAGTSSSSKKRPREEGDVGRGGRGGSPDVGGEDNHNDDNDTKNDDDQEQQLLQLLVVGDEDGDGDALFFVSPEEASRREAERRRAERRKRLRPAGEAEGGVVEGAVAVDVAPPSNHDASRTSRSAPADGSTTLPPPGGQDGKDRPQQPSRDAWDVRRIDDDDDNDDDDGGGINMFLTSDSPEVPVTTAGAPTTTASDPQLQPSGTVEAGAAAPRPHHQEDCDDAEGYYKATIGEIIDLPVGAGSTDSPSSTSSCKLRVLGVVGKGVFSTVLQCQVLEQPPSLPTEAGNSPGNGAPPNSIPPSPLLPGTVAVKCVRHNDSMAKAAAQEVRILQQLAGAPGVVPLLLPRHRDQPLLHRGHVALVMEYGECNLRTVLQRFGRGVGLSLTAVKSYFAQLLAALEHLRTRRIVHADLKPDNILVAASDFGRVMIADFGSATASDDQSPLPTPYLVSRFYRAPEIILGLSPVSHPIDLWSLAATVAELFTGSVLFKGGTNNEMLQTFQQTLKVALPNRLIRQHLRQCATHPNVPAHFVPQGTAFLFRQQAIDPVTGQPFHRHLPLQQLLQGGTKQDRSSSSSMSSSSSSLPELLHRAAGREERGAVGQLADLLHKCLALDPTKRIEPRAALKHEFFVTRDNKAAVTAKAQTT